MDFLFNSIKNKKPFGGVPTDERIEIEFPIKYSVNANKIDIIIRNYEGDKVIAYSLILAYTDGIYNIYKVEFNLSEYGIYYYRFEVHCDDGVWFIGKGRGGQAVRGDYLPEWQLTIYDRSYDTPKFIKGGVIYHIFIDRFNKSGDIPFNKKGKLKSWNTDVTIHEADGTYLANDFFGGNFQGIIDKLDYLKSLNVSLIYLSPIFESSSNHRYDTGDYMKLDELLGSEDDFRRLINEAEERGIGIMLDGVFNHSGSDSIYFNKYGNYNSLGAYQSKNSPYYDWYTFIKYPEIYDCWWGITVVPTINKSNKNYRKYLLGKKGVLDKWTRFNIKGWRLDVVDELPADLVFEIRKKVKSINQDVLIIGEVWEDASIKESYGTLRPYLTGGQLDGVMNYPFREAIIDYVKNNDAELFADRIMKICENYPLPALNAMMNVIGTHDTVRIINVMSDLNAPTKQERQYIIIESDILKKARARVKVAAALQYILPGVPSIYYGDEVGLQGFEDPLNRRTFPWGYEDEELLRHYKILGEIRKEHKYALVGSIRFIPHKDLLICLRETKGESIALIVNVSGKKQSFTNPYKGVNLYTRQTMDIGKYEIDNLDTFIISY